MKFNCHQKDLARALVLVVRAVRRNHTVPILDHLLLETEADRLRVAASDGELFIIAHVPAVVREPGAATLLAHTFVDWVQTLPDAPLGARLTTRTQSVDFVCGRMRATLKGLPASEYPNLPTLESANAPALAAIDLCQAIESVVFAAANDQSRPILNGVLVHVEGTRFTLAATDGIRIAERTLLLASTVSETASAVVPARALKELALGLRQLQAGTPVRLGLRPDGAQAWFDAGTLAVVTQTVSGAFPDYRRIIPADGAQTTRVQIECADFQMAVQSAEVIARENGHTLQLTLVNGSATLSAIAAETGENVIELPTTLEGAPLTIAFNSRYLRESIEALDTAQATLDLTTPTSPGVIRPVGHTGQLCLLMPMTTHA